MAIERSQGVRWGIIGVGSVAEHKSGPAFIQAAGGTLVGVASRRREAAADYAKRHGVPHVFDTPSELISSELIDAVYIATPPSSHLPLALKVARAGKPCCVEKPMAIYLSEAEQLVRAFAAANRPLFVSFYRRTLPRFLKVEQLLKEGAIGQVRAISWRLGRVASRASADAWRLDPAQAPGGLFEDLACHGLDLFDYLLGPIVKVDDAQVRQPASLKVPDRIEATWRHDGEVIGRGVWDFAADENLDAVAIAGDDGAIHFAIFDEGPVELRRSDEIDAFTIPNPTPIQLPHVIALNEALNDGTQHPSTAASALRTAWVSEQILRGPTSRRG